MMEDPGNGPYVQLAAFCECVLTENDGVISLIRVIDRMTVTVPASSGEHPTKEHSFTVAYQLAIALKSGRARGSHTIRVRQESPSGLRSELTSVSVLFEGEDRGAGVILDLRLQFSEEGLYWFDVLLGERLLTRIPFRVLFTRVAVGGTPLGPSS